jgi:hypothetical protein
MAIERIASAAVVPSPDRAHRTSTARFELPARDRSVSSPASSETEPRWVAPHRAHPVEPGAWLARVSAAQARMDRILALAASGRTFTPAELLSLQAGVAEASQTVDLAGKVLDRVSGGVKTVLQTQV